MEEVGSKCIYYMVLLIENSQKCKLPRMDRKQVSGCEEGGTTKSKNTLGVMITSIISIAAVAPWVYTYVKNINYTSSICVNY